MEATLLFYSSENNIVLTSACRPVNSYVQLGTMLPHPNSWHRVLCACNEHQRCVVLCAPLLSAPHEGSHQKMGVKDSFDNGSAEGRQAAPLELGETLTLQTVHPTLLYDAKNQ